MSTSNTSAPVNGADEREVPAGFAPAFADTDPIRASELHALWKKADPGHQEGRDPASELCWQLGQFASLIQRAGAAQVPERRCEHGCNGCEDCTDYEEEAQAPALWVSPEQAAAHTDLDHPEAGRYLPCRRTPAGKFTMPLYAYPLAGAAQVPSLKKDGS